MYHYERSSRLRFVKFKKLQYNVECIARESQNVYKILSVMLPKSIINRLVSSEFQFSTVTDRFDPAYCIFIEFFGKDLQSFDVELAAFLVNETFRTLDRFLRRYKEFEKIKTICSKVMLLAKPDLEGTDIIPSRMTKMFLQLFEKFSSLTHKEVRSLHAFGQHMQETSDNGTSWEKDWTTLKRRIRIGVDRGPVVAGIVGEEKFCYDLYGDTVNTSSRMQCFANNNSCHCTKAVYNCLSDSESTLSHT
ncbi:adenylate and guanylate cyclase catalytic domain-containing protein [Chytridium lagenaria]|nr:adenylate and guanylate cyclase catalytic domain-containing protein [Chytridium lagenaria]